VGRWRVAVVVDLGCEVVVAWRVLDAARKKNIPIDLDLSGDIPGPSRMLGVPLGGGMLNKRSRLNVMLEENT
jgi:hypothetical protein